MEQIYNIPLNEFQTPIEKLHIEKSPQEVKEQFFDFINNVPLIKRLISPKRKRAKDLPKDSSGKIIVDVTDPHIIEDTDYFRPSAIKFQKDGRYTDLRPNPNPNSEYGKWIREEIRRCYEGYVRESDGEWITGDMYFFLNYCPIQLIKKEKNGKNIRVLDFPLFWEGHYYKFHYLEQCREQGKHAVELASRFKGKSYCGAALLAKRFVLGESKYVNKKVQCMVTASEKKYLTGGNQILDMFQYYIDFCANNTQFPYRRITSSLQNMQWTMGYIDANTNTRQGTGNSVMGITSKDDESKLRGTRGVLYLIEEAGTFPRLLNLFQVLLPSVQDGKAVYGLIFAYGCVTKNNKVWTLDGRYINVDQLQREDGIIGSDYQGITRNAIGSLIPPKKKHCLRITLSNNNTIECSLDHPILKQVIHTPRVKGSNKRLRIFTEGFEYAERLKVGDRIVEERGVPVFGQDTVFDPYFIGIMIGDGSYRYNGVPTFSSQDFELQEYITKRYNAYVTREYETKKGKQYKEYRIRNICKKLREVGIYGQVGINKRLPQNYQTLSKADTGELLAGLYDTDGYIGFNKRNSSIVLTQSSVELLKQVQVLLRKFGITSNIQKILPYIKEGRKDKKEWYILYIKGIISICNFYNNIPIKIAYKKEALNKILNWFAENPSKKPCGYDKERFVVNKIVKIEDIGEQEIYNLSAIASKTYLVNNIITHNTAGDTESDFSAMQEMMYNPVGYNVKELNNVFDKEGQGRREFSFFFPGYINRAECYNKDGISDVTKALFEILMERYTVKHNSTDINAITKKIAEIPVTPQEAILKSKGNMFPITQLNERINEIDNNPNFYDDTYVGELFMKKDGKVEFKPTNDEPIRVFQLKDNKVKGALEIYQMPELDKSGKVYRDRYIIGHDPVDSDVSGTMSLSSTLVLDLFTDKIVAEYTGRSEFADDNFEKLRLLCIFYNAKCLYENNLKGVYSYFSRFNCTHMLADTPEYLRDKQLIKSSGWGNASKGVTATAAINNYANELIKAWLLKPVPTIVEDAEGQHEINVLNLYFIKNRALLKELVAFNPFINVDRVRALGMVMLYREEKLILYRGDVRTNSLAEDSTFIGNDEFFTRNYDEKFAGSKFSALP